jgi:hypothetical protein
LSSLIAPPGRRTRPDDIIPRCVIVPDAARGGGVFTSSVRGFTMFGQASQQSRLAPSSSSTGHPGRGRARRLTRSVALWLAALVGIAATSAGAFSAQSAGKTLSVVCRGGGSSCSAVVSLAGDAGNEKLRIALSDTDLKLTGTVAKPAFVQGAYQLSHGGYSLGGSLYTVTLNAVQSIPKGATLTLKFAVPAKALGCKSVTKGISSLTIAKLGAKQARGAYGCQTANAVSNTWALRFEAREQVQTFSVDNVRYTCKLVPTLPANTQCDGGGTRVKFAAPTGH